MSLKRKLRVIFAGVILATKISVVCGISTAAVWLMEPYIFDVMFEILILPNRTGFDVLIADSVPYLATLTIWGMGFFILKLKWPGVAAEAAVDNRVCPTRVD